jgi:hypothetical protein
MAKPALTVHVAFERLIDEFGEDEVRSLSEEWVGKAKRRMRVKDGKGAPSINRSVRDSMVCMLVMALRFGTKKSVVWCCRWLAKNADIEIMGWKDSQSLSSAPIPQANIPEELMLIRTLDNAETIRRIYNSVYKSFDDDHHFVMHAVHSLLLLLDERQATDTPRFVIMRVIEGASLYVSIKNAGSLFEGLDIISGRLGLAPPEHAKRTER